MPSLRTLRPLLGPRWLTQGGDSELVGYSLDVLADASVERIRRGLLARFPQGNGRTLPPADALEAMGKDRRVIRGIGETDEEYAERLIPWLDDRKTQGGPFALMRTLAAYVRGGSSFRTVDQRGNWFSRSAAGVETYTLNTGNWNWDGSPASEWSKFWAIIYPGTTWAQTLTWGGTGLAWGGTGLTWGTTATPGQVKTTRQIVREWKPAGTTCVNIIVAFDLASFNPASPEPDGTWGVPANRLSTAAYWDGT